MLGGSRLVDILIVDDRPENLLALEAVLKSPEYRLTRANSGEEALEAVLLKDFVVILLDIQMPGIDGFETAERIRELLKGREIPIVFVTAASSDQRLIERGYRIGAVDYVFKPIDPLALRAKVRVLVDLFLKNRALLEAQEELKHAHDELERRVEERTAALREREAKLLASEHKFATVFASAPVAMTLIQAEGGAFVDVNPAFERTFGYAKSEVLGKTSGELGMHADPVSRQRIIDEFKRSHSVRNMESKVVAKTGKVLTISNNIDLLELDGQKFILSTLEDVTERRKAEDALRESEEHFRTLGHTLRTSAVELERAVAARTIELRQSEAFLDSVIDNIPNMVFVKDARDLRYVRFNKAGANLVGVPQSVLLGKNDFDFFPREEAEGYVSKDREVLAGREIIDIPEEPLETQHLGKRVLHTRKIPIFDAQGKPQYLLGISEDITEQKKAEAARLQSIRDQAAVEERKRESERATYLANASTVLASSLDYHQTLNELAKLTLPQIADWCTVTILRTDGTMERVAAVHQDPEKAPFIDELAKYYPINPSDPSGIGEVIATGKTVFTPIVTEAALSGAAKDERHLLIMQALGCASCIIAPVATRGKVLGAISLCSAGSNRIYNENDLALAEELGRRAGIAIDNAFLYEKAQQAIRSRDEFMSIASHELKTPITSLKLQLQITRKNTKPTEGLMPSPQNLSRMLDVSVVQVNRLTTLVDDLLDITRIQTGKLAFNFEQFDVAALVTEMVDRYREHLHSAGCTVQISASDPIRICADKFRLEQVIINLLSNAAKYGSSKPVDITVEKTGEHLVRIACRDHGIGIAPDKLEKVFERFERAISSDNISGLGLGLYIAREIVRAHEGTIRVQSVLGEGSTFTVELPVVNSHAMDAPVDAGGIRWVNPTLRVPRKTGEQA